MKKTLRQLKEDLQGLISYPSIGVIVKCEDLASFELIQTLMSVSIKQVGLANHLTPDDLRTWNTFVLGVERSASMSPTAGRGHLGAIWRAGAAEVARQLPNDVAERLEDAITTFLDEGPQG